MCVRKPVVRNRIRIPVTKNNPLLLIGILMLIHPFAGQLGAQNLITNNGFETNTSVPNGYGQWNLCQGWSNVNNYIGFSWPYASPDYLRVGAGGGVGLPSSTFATVNPYSGNAIMGFIAYYAPSADFREYLAHPLASPMIPGQAYSISFYMTNGMANWYCGAGCNRVGIRFSIGPLTQVTHEPLNIIPHCEIAVKWWSTTWQLVSFTFIPSSAFNYMTIGNFYNDLNTSHSMYGTGANGAYYFIDEMSVMPSIPLPVEWLDFNAKKVDGGNLLAWSTASETNSAYFRIERSDDGESFTGIGNKMAAGTAVNKNDYSFLDTDFQSHTWYYRLNLIDRDGEESRSAVIAIQPRHGNNLQLFHDPSDSHKVNGLLPEEMKSSLLYVFNSQGALITSSPLHERTFEVTLPHTGVYIFYIISEKGAISKKWLVID